MVKVTNNLPWDKTISSEPVFTLTTPTLKEGMFYYGPLGKPQDYNKDNTFGKFMNFTDGIVVNHTYVAWI
jgi:hypothetical protein